MLTVYDFDSTRDFLRVTWENKKARNPSFSIRAWAQQLGFKSHNSLYQIINGQRTMPKSMIPKLKSSLKLAAKEVRYLEALVDLEKSKTQTESEIYLERLQKLSPKLNHSFIEIQNYEFFRDPVKAAIGELATTKGFKVDAKWIKQQLVFDVTVYEVNRALDCLKNIGLLVESKDGKLQRSKARIASTNDIKSLALQDYHKKLCTLAAKEVSEQDVDKREYHGFLFNIKKEDIKDAKQKIREFIKEFSNEFEAPVGVSADTYCLQTNLFSLIKDNTKEKKK